MAKQCAQTEQDRSHTIYGSLNLNYVHSQEREKRRRRVLVEQLASHESIEQSKHEDMLVTCLMRQSQLERRIALQLLQVRLEKDVIRNNR